MGLLSKAAGQPARGSLLRKIEGKAERTATSSNPPAGSPEDDDEVGRFLQDRGPFRGIVLELPSGAEGNNFIPRLEKILSSLGSVCSLSPRSCLVLVSDSTDAELLAHRLSKSLKVRVFHRFMAGTPAGALEQLSLYR
jgi:hypothetical protein